MRGADAAGICVRIANASCGRIAASYARTHLYGHNELTQMLLSKVDISPNASRAGGHTDSPRRCTACHPLEAEAAS